MIYIGSGYAPNPINRLVTCPKQRKRDRDRARKAAMSSEQRALLNKRRRELYAQENASKKSAKILQMTPKETFQSTGIAIIVISLHKKFRGVVGYLLYQ
jgi:hypothetical protein